MALIDLSSDLSKFRANVKSSGETRPDTSKAKSSRVFGALQPISERISSLSPTINKPKSNEMENKLSSTKLDDIVKRMSNDLIINSVSRYSPVNLEDKRNFTAQPQIEDITSKFQEIRKTNLTSQLNKSDVLILRSESGTNNLNSPIAVNMLLAKTIDRKNSSPNVFAVKNTDNKEISSPKIGRDVNDSSDNITNPDIQLQSIPLTFDRRGTSPDVLPSLGVKDKGNQSPDVLDSSAIQDKSGQSPDVVESNRVQDKSGQSPDVLDAIGIQDKSGQSPDVLLSTTNQDKSSQSPDILLPKSISDKSTQSPDVLDAVGIQDKSGQSLDVFGTTQTDNKEISSPSIKTDNLEYVGNITDPKTLVFGKPLSFDRADQSVLINKDLISPLNNVINPNISLEKSQLFFDRTEQSPEIFTETLKQGLVKDPNTKVFRIEQGTNHLQDESRLNPDGIPFRFETTSRLQNRQPQNPVDDKRRYSGQSIQIVDNSRLNADDTQKTTPFGRNENPDKSILSVKGTQQVNFITDRNAGGFTAKPSKGVTEYKNNSEYTWQGGRSNAPETNFIVDRNGNGFTKLVTPLLSQYNSESSVFTWKGARQQAPQTNFFADSNANGFVSFATKLETKYDGESSEFVFKGVNPKPVDYFVNNNGSGFTTKVTHLISEYSKDSSAFSFKGSSRQAPSVNYIPNDVNGGFTTFPQSLSTEFKQDISKFGFKGSSRQAPSVNFIQNDISTGFTTFVQSRKTEFKKDSSSFTFKGTSRQANTVNYLTDNFNTGFTSYPQSQITEFKTDISRYGFKGGRDTAPETNFFVDTPSIGFKRITPFLDTKYNSNVSKFTWVGNRQNSPEVNFFYIPGPNPDAISGFNRLFIDKSETKLSDQYSSLSFAGTTVRSAVRPVPYTSFFGYTPSERKGFMVNMSTFDGTLYPNISPLLNYNADGGSRLSIEVARAIRGGMKTTKVSDEKYAPKSLGPRPWIDGTLVSTLDSQIPDGQIKTGAKAGSYLKKYETALREGTDGLGFVTKWATTRRSPSPLDNQYNKYKLQKESVNREPAFFFQPYVVRGIQRDGEVENQRWGFGVTFDDGIVRGGVVTQTERIIADTIRLGKWTASIKGLLFNIRQVGLQLMNPNVDINPSKPESSFLGTPATQIFNPLSILANVASARAGLHLPRHGVVPFSKDYLNRYEDATIARENKSKFIDPNYKKFDDLETPTLVDRQKDYNRLIGLMKELLPNSFKPVVATDVSSDPTTSALAKAGIELAKKLTGQTGITRLSTTFGGPQSMLGIGGTQINRASHPYLTSYTTTPLLMLTGEQKEPQYQASAKRNTYYAALATYKESFNLSNTLRTIAYNLPNGPYEINDENITRNSKNITNLQPSTVQRIEKLNPFDPKYDLFDNRLQALDGNKIQPKESLAKGVNPIHANGSNPLLQYRTATYDKLGVTRDRRRSKNSTTNAGEFNDFRADLDLDNPQIQSFITDPDVVNYADNNLEDRFGFGKHGKVGAKRNKPFMNTISYAKAKEGHSIPRLKDPENEFRGDRINIIDYKRGKFEISKEFVYEVGAYNNGNLPGAEDLVEFYFTGLDINGTQSRPAEVIVFRATFGNISDSHNSDWSTIKYMGRADPLYVYQGYDRDISFDFTVQLTSRDEMKASWRKLNHLASWTAPEYTKGGFMKAPIIRLNIGNLYRKMPGFMTSIRYNFDNTETTWETAKLKDDRNLLGQTGDQSSPGVLQLPKTIRVECTFTPIGVYRPEYNGVMYSLFDDSAAGRLENGLIPNDDVRVNYFKSFDVDETGNKQGFDTQDNRKYYKIAPGTESTIPVVTPEERESISGKQESSNSQTNPKPTVPDGFQGPATDTTTYRYAPGENTSPYETTDR